MVEVSAQENARIMLQRQRERHACRERNRGRSGRQASRPIPPPQELEHENP